MIGRGGSAKRKSAAGVVSYRVGSKYGAAAMAYRSGTKLTCPITGQVFDYSYKAKIDKDGFGILYTEVPLPNRAPPDFADRQMLINALEAAEKRKDAQLFREVEVSMPRELNLQQQIALVRAFVESQFVAKGMIADIALHDERASDGGRNPHAHILLSTRRVTEAGFGLKERAWNDRRLVQEYREAWTEMANEALREAGVEKRIDHRSHKDRDIELEPDVYVGPSVKNDFDGVISDWRQEVRKGVHARNAAALDLEPELLIKSVAREKATFTHRDLCNAARRATGYGFSDPRVEALADRACAAKDNVLVHSDAQGAHRYATRDMIECETKMARAAQSLVNRKASSPAPTPPEDLSEEQQRAYKHIMWGPDLTCVHGVAGAGKTTLLRSVAAAYKAQGKRVRGGALAGIAVRKLGDEAGIPAATIFSMARSWEKGDALGAPPEKSPLQANDVLIIDEAGMVASRDMQRLLAEAEKSGARVILVGDTQQLQAIEAGAAFRALCDTHGAAELKEVRRQEQAWMRSATKALSVGDVETALDMYRQTGAVRESPTHDGAIEAVIAAWAADRAKGGSQIILAHSNADVHRLNTSARAVLRARGELGPDIKVQVRERVHDDNGEIMQRAQNRTFANGDRILFMQNHGRLDVQNGTLGDVVSVEKGGQFVVKLDGGRVVSFNAKECPDISQGYALTIHKTHGATVDRAYVLASARFNANLSYTALSRHRLNVEVFYGRDQFGQGAGLIEACKRQEVKDSTLDYLEPYLARLRTEREKQTGRSGGRGGDYRLATQAAPARSATASKSESASPTPPRAPESSNPSSASRRAGARERAQAMKKDRGREFDY